ncbi:hypothetical protein ACFSSC_03780 [Corynebacterium mendelii]|uniref:Uncharacterized protein n=1 Tax=Corynebacterium mendelii TaxID=2765362 RepID=A0A939IUR2_9CORY|nr:hypothetical protein [Corynebacterium mendelii]MBN9643476.1 hypothetical protein [Corynebacterium mendelii]
MKWSLSATAGKRWIFTYTIVNTGSSPLKDFTLVDQAVVTGAAGIPERRAKLDLTGLTCTAASRDGKKGDKDLPVTVTVEDDNTTAAITLDNNDTLGHRGTVTCVLNNVDLNEMEYTVDYARRLFAVTATVVPEQGQRLAANQDTVSKSVSTLFKKQDASRFVSTLTTGPAPDNRVLDGREGQKIAAEFTLEVSNTSPRYSHTPTTVSVDVSGIADGIEVTSVTLSPVNPVGGNRLVDDEIPLNKTPAGIWQTTRGLNTIAGNSSGRAIVRVTARVDKVPGADHRQCNNKPHSGLFVSAATDSGSATSACLAMALQQASFHRTISTIEGQPGRAANTPGSPFSVAPHQRVWFGWTVRNTGESTLGDMIVHDYDLQVVNGRNDTEVANRIPESLTCDNGATAEKSVDGKGFSVTFGSTGLLPGQAVTCAYGNGSEPLWQGNRSQTKSAARIRSKFFKRHVADEPPALLDAESTVYARQPGPSVFVSQITNKGQGDSRHAPVVVTGAKDQKIAVTWLVNVRNFDYRETLRPGDLGFTATTLPGTAITALSVTPLENKDDSLVDEPRVVTDPASGLLIVRKNEINGIAPNTTRAAYVTALYTVTDPVALIRDRDTLSCGTKGGFSLTSGAGHDCRDVAFAQIAGDVSINGSKKFQFDNPRSATVTYTVRNTGNASLPTIQLYDAGWMPREDTPDPTDIMVGPTRVMDHVSCQPSSIGGVVPQLVHRRRHDTGGADVHSVLLSFPENKPFQPNSRIECTRTVSYDEMFGGGTNHYGVHFWADGYASFPVMQQKNGGSTPGAVSSQNVDARAEVVTQPTAGGGGRDTNDNRPGPNRQPGGGTETPRVEPAPDVSSTGGAGIAALVVVPLLAVVAAIIYLLMPKQGIGATLLYFPAEGTFHVV